MTAYATTWAPTLLEQDGKRQLLRISPNALDSWLTAVRAGDVPVLLGHEIFLRIMSAITGITAERARDEARDEARLADWVTAEIVDRAEKLARTIAKASRAAEVALTFWRRASDSREREQEFRDYLEANRTVRRSEEELRELLVNDEAVISNVLRRANVRR